MGVKAALTGSLSIVGCEAQRRHSKSRPERTLVDEHRVHLVTKRHEEVLNAADPSDKAAFIVAYVVTDTAFNVDQAHIYVHGPRS